MPGAPAEGHAATGDGHLGPGERPLSSPTAQVTAQAGDKAEPGNSLMLTVAAVPLEAPGKS